MSAILAKQNVVDVHVTHGKRVTTPSRGDLKVSQ